jgi:hypothetical protein
MPFAAGTLNRGRRLAPPDAVRRARLDFDAHCCGLTRTLRRGGYPDTRDSRFATAHRARCTAAEFDFFRTP